MFSSIYHIGLDGTIAAVIALCVSLVLGALVAGVYIYHNSYTKGFVVTLALLPAIVQAVIMLVNGNVGVGVAVMGAFSLVRFRSMPGTAREIMSIFFSMAVGLAVGTGYIGYAVLFTLAIGVAMLFYNTIHFGEGGSKQRILIILIPEHLDYTGLFDDLFEQHTRKATLESVRTTNLGSLYELRYMILLKKVSEEKALLDQIRQRNGNLNVSSSRGAQGRELL